MTQMVDYEREIENLENGKHKLLRKCRDIDGQIKHLKKLKKRKDQ